MECDIIQGYQHNICTIKRKSTKNEMAENDLLSALNNLLRNQAKDMFMI